MRGLACAAYTPDMPTPISNFNVVLIGENFPVQTVQVSDFTYRGRQLREQLRMGPALQAGARGVGIVALPDRFQVSITEPDDLDIQTQGVQEILEVFRDYIGRRSATHLGHNAQILMPSSHAGPVIDSLVERRQAALFLDVQEVSEAAVTLVNKLPRGVTEKLAVGQADDGQLVLDFNFDYDLAARAVTFEEAASDLLKSLRSVEQVHGRIQAFVADKGRVTS